MRNSKRAAELAAAKIQSEARRIASLISEMEMSEELAEFGPRILEIMKGVSVDAFWILDEKPGQFSYMNGRFYMLRRVRNDCHTDTNFGNVMFANFAK